MVAYVMMSYRIAYYKVYYPVEFYSTFFTTKVNDFDAETIMKGSKAVREKIELIEAKGKNATNKEAEELTVLEVAYEMYARGYEFYPAKLGNHTRSFAGRWKSKTPFSLICVGETSKSPSDRIC